MAQKIKIKQLTSGLETSGKTLLSDGSGLLSFGYSQSEKGTIFPIKPVNGDKFYYLIDNEEYIFDGVRDKWLSLKRETIILGRNSIAFNVSAYLGIADNVHSSTSGILMKYNGTILSASIDNNNNMNSDRIIEIRVNNSLSNKVVLTILNGTKSISVNNANINFESGDILHSIALNNDVEPSLENISLIIEIAKRN
jgi:hypothetical protein